MSGTSRSVVNSSSSGRIKTENPALVKILTSDSLTDTRLVAAEHKSLAHTPHASTNVTTKQGTFGNIDNSSGSHINSDKNSITENRPSSRYSDKNGSDKENIDLRPSSRYSEKNSTGRHNSDSQPNSRHLSKYTAENIDIENRPDSRYSEKSGSEKGPVEKRSDSRYSAKNDSNEKQKYDSNRSSWGNVDESLTFDINNLNKIENFERTSQGSTTPTKTIETNKYYNKENTSDNHYTEKLPSSDSIKLAGNKSGNDTPSQIDYLKVQRIESPTFERSRSREENKTPGGNSQSYSYNRLKNLSTSASQQHPSLVARSASQLIDAQGDGGLEADSLDIDSGLVPDTTSLLESAPETGRHTHRVTTPVSKNVPVINSANSSRYRANSRTSQRSLLGYGANVAPPQYPRNESVVSDNGIPPPSNIESVPSLAAPQLPRNESVVSDNGIPPRSNANYNLPASDNFDDVNEDNISVSKKFDQRKSAVSFKEPVISDYHNHSEAQDDWDTPRERIPTPHPASPQKFQDSLDFNGELGRYSNLSPEPTHQLEADIPSVLDSQVFPSEPVRDENSAKSGRSVKKIYIDSPTFTKEEEEEFRFVESRIDEANDDLEDTVRRIEDQGNRYKQEREAMNEEAARLRAEIQATEGYSNSYNSRNTNSYAQRDNYSDNYNKPITHPSDDMESRSYGRPQDQENGYRQDRYQNGYPNQTQSFGNLRDSMDVYNARNDNRYEDRNLDDQEEYSGTNREYNPNAYARNQDRYQQNQVDNSVDRGQPHYDRRGDSPSRYGNGDEKGDEELERETEYQEDLRHRVESGLKHDSELVIPRIPIEDNQFRDSLDEQGYNDQRNFARDSLEGDGYGKWGNPPPNPFGQGHGENAKYLDNQGNRPDFVDDNDTARMEILHPIEPKVDYVEENKMTYGLPPSKSYRDLKVKEKEAEQKLTEIFIHPKRPGKKHKRTIPLKNEERRPPLSELKGPDQGAEGVWAKRSAQLSKHKDSKVTSAGNIKKSRGLQKYPSDSGIHSPNKGQIHMGQGRMYGTPTRNQYLEPLGYKPQISKEEPRQSPVFRDTGSYKKPIELEPIKTEIITDDGQKISVDINLKVMSPTFQRRVKSHPDGTSGGAPPFNVHAELVPKQNGDRRQGRFQPANLGRGDQPNSEIQYTSQPSDNRSPIRQSPHNSLLNSQQNSQQGNRQYQENQYNRQYQFSMGSMGYWEEPYQQQRDDSRSHNYEGLSQPYDSNPYPRRNDYDGIDEEALRKQEEALMAELNLSPNPYAKIPPIPIRDELTVPVMVEKGGYAAMYQDNKHKDPNQQPWYQVYTVKDFKKMQKEMRLNRGTLGPDLDNETYKDKLEKRHKQFEYARMVMEKNKNELHDTKKPITSRKDPQTEEAEKSKRKAQVNPTRKALDYAKNVPKPTVKPRPTQYNSYEVASQLSPIAKQTGSKSPTHTQNMDVIDLKKLQQRHEQEKRNVALMRQNMETVPQKA